jgi:hypothetical protein
MMLHLRIQRNTTSRAPWRPGPRLWAKGPQRQGGLLEQGHQDGDPAAAKATDQAPAGGAALPALAGQGVRPIEPCARGERRLGHAAPAQPPQRRDRDRQPQARGPLRLGQTGALPRPAGALHPLTRRLEPGPPPLPASRAGVGGQLGPPQPGGGVACRPAGQPGAPQAPLWAFAGGAGAPPAGPGVGPEAAPWAGGRLRVRAQGAPAVEAQTRGPAQPANAAQQPAGLQAASGHHDHGPRAGHGRPPLAQPAPPCTAPGLGPVGQQERPGHGNRTAARDDAAGHHRAARAQGGGLESPGDLGPLPATQHPAPQGLNTRVAGERWTALPPVGRDLLPDLPPRLPPGRRRAVAPTSQEDGHGRQGTRAGEHQAQTPPGQHRGLGLTQQRHRGPNDSCPFGNPALARQGRPPGITGVRGDPPDVPRRTVVPACPSHVLKNLPL